MRRRRRALRRDCEDDGDPRRLFDFLFAFHPGRHYNSILIYANKT
jgi:hypothetical protein